MTDMRKTYQVVVHGTGGKMTTIDLCNTDEQMKSMKVLQLKEKITEKLPEMAGSAGIRLIFADKHLDEDSKTLSSYGIQHNSHIMIVVRMHGGLIS
ncbi:uncharacterized protein zgc:194655 [Xyrichtys novacula]|uniref:Uncharacterized protein zgc:194655 n=1 Tax=Xyrichtys novacula TaxID=13765 RepID=A0AAV1HJQ0_XYRNO|nr:uncharacterized protein zgc:194655 [Xyrichtys novacula]